MGVNISRILIEVTVRKSLREIQKSPERGIRNLIDMGLNFSDGRFQRQFFEIAQGMLRNENSAYYPLVKDLVAHVERDTIVTFGMNLGYNSFTKGAERIRQLEAERGYNIPWSVWAEVDAEQCADPSAQYAPLLRQGKELGIFTYLLRVQGSFDPLLPLLLANGECAFVLFGAAEQISPAFVAQAKGLHNVMLALTASPGQAEMCRWLRQEKLLYSVCVDYGEDTLPQLLAGETLQSLVPLHPVFLLLLAEDGCPAQVRERAYAYACKVRSAQELPSFVMDVRQDAVFIDAIISDDACSVCFGADGSVRNAPKPCDKDLFRDRLEEILKELFPKSVQKE